MGKVITSICLFLLLCFSAQSKAQHLQVKAIEIYTPSYNATDDLGSYSSFVSKTRNPALFSSGILDNIEQEASINSAGFSIDFVFHNPENPRNEFIFGLQSTTITTELFDELPIQQDTLQGFSSLENRSQYFFLRGGYQRLFRSAKKLNFIVGSSLQFGIPVAAKTSQSSDNTAIIDVNEFFAKQSVSMGVSINLGIRLKLFRNISSSLTASPTLFYHRVDGSLSTALLRGTYLSTQFAIRRK